MLNFNRCRMLWLLAVFCGWSAISAEAKTLDVGEGKPFDRIEKANAVAQSGDVILVYALKNGRAYEKTSVFVRQKNLTLCGAPGKGKMRVLISGEGFDYSGRGSTPRAIFQFNRGADGCKLEGFELFGAHNESHNGAGMRINQANGDAKQGYQQIAAVRGGAQMRNLQMRSLTGRQNWFAGDRPVRKNARTRKN